MGKPAVSNKEANTKIVGAALAEVLPNTDKWWWQQPHLLALNLRLAVLLLSSSVTGYDGEQQQPGHVTNTWSRK